jgi:hypothetical protein
MDEAVVSRELGWLMEQGEVEALRPLKGDEAGARRAVATREHYRLVRETDNDFLCEQEVVVRMPSSRIYDVLQQEERRAVPEETRYGWDMPAKQRPLWSFS